MLIPGNLLTTAMAVIPQTNVPQALALALFLDVPFWPQLPNYYYYEDMYVQAAEYFPGILLTGLLFAASWRVRSVLGSIFLIRMKGLSSLTYYKAKKI